MRHEHPCLAQHISATEGIETGPAVGIKAPFSLRNFVHGHGTSAVPRLSDITVFIVRPYMAGGVLGFRAPFSLTVGLIG